MPALRAANDDLEKRRAADPSSVDIENVGEEGEPHIEMVTAPASPAAATHTLPPDARRRACPRQNLGCGIFEAQPAGQPAAGSSDDGGDSDSEALQLPSQQTAAVAAAARAGRVLVSEVVDDAKPAVDGSSAGASASAAAATKRGAAGAGPPPKRPGRNAR